MILGYLCATLVIRLSQTVSRFFLAPGSERLRLVPMTTPRACSGTAGCGRWP